MHCIVFGIVSDIVMHPIGRREDKREVITVTYKAEPAVSCSIKILPDSAPMW